MVSFKMNVLVVVCALAVACGAIGSTVAAGPLQGENSRSRDPFSGRDFDGDGRFTLSEEIDPNATEAMSTSSATPLLIILMEFSDSNMSTLLPDPESAWADLMFGSDQAEGNHYWNEVTGGQFQLAAARETFGVADNGVVRVWIPNARPTGTQQYQIELQTWIPDSLDLASALHPVRRLRHELRRASGQR